MVENPDSYLSKKEQEYLLTDPEQLRKIGIDEIAENLDRLQEQDPKAAGRTMEKLHMIYTVAFGDEREMEL